MYKDQKLRSGIQSMVVKMGGSRDDVEEIFTTTLIQFVKTVLKNPDLTITHELRTYISGIARYVWLGRFKKNQPILTDNGRESDGDWEDSPETLVVRQDQKHLLHDLLKRIGKNCREVLMYWAHGYKMKEIADMMNYNSEGMAKKKKYQCFKTLVEYLDQHPEVKEALRK